MQTDEELVSALGQDAEAEIHQLVHALVNTSDLQLKTLEQHVVQVVFGLGRRWLERLLDWQTAHPATAHREARLWASSALGGLAPENTLDLAWAGGMEPSLLPVSGNGSGPP